jgi:serine/threonine-protein kinase HipA
MGADCAGAVQVVPPGRPPDQAGELTPISPAEIGLHIRRLRADAAAWDFPERGGRWSLGGQQGKFALARNGDGEWLLPSGRAASTHIVKVGVSGVPGSDVAEFVTMRAAALLGLPVPPVAFSVFDGESALVATRFDRIVEAGGVRRVHQEDLCQALGLWRTMKYQADGGPSAGAVIDFLRRALDRRDREAGLRDFARAQVFHWIVAGTDAHAKNHAVLHTGSLVTLAPFFALLSTAFLWPAREVHFEGRLAMKFGGEYRLRKVDAGRFDHAAAELGVDESWLIAVARLYRDRLPDVVDAALAELPPTVAPVERARLRDAMAARLEWVCVP